MAPEDWRGLPLIPREEVSDNPRHYYIQLLDEYHTGYNHIMELIDRAKLPVTVPRCGDWFALVDTNLPIKFLCCCRYENVATLVTSKDAVDLCNLSDERIRIQSYKWNPSGGHYDTVSVNRYTVEDAQQVLHKLADNGYVIMSTSQVTISRIAAERYQRLGLVELTPR